MLSRYAASTLSASFSRLSVHAPVASTSRVAVRPRALPSLAALSRPFSSTLPAQRSTVGQVLRGCRKTIVKQSKAPLLEQCFQKKGVVSKVYTVKPRKPNSAVRKVCKVKLSTGNSCIAYIPGEGHNLQEHHVVLIRGGRTKDIPGCRYKVVRGALDLNGVAGRVSARSKYGVKKPKKT
ncbi:hypothetical protein CspHIS471_0606340 [Cutaneotrichosporon sp. HIS471]|nr:hypothetical protein CspHIS471_0606340 [Cutaneotrichosporon sp. HIS471]